MKILIVDDDRLNLKITTTTLKSKEQWEVIGASSGQKAIELAVKEKPDLILLDALMPEMDGLTTLQKLREQESTAKIPIIFLTGSSEAVESYKISGVLGVLSKPFNPSTLHVEILRLLEEREKSGPTERISPAATQNLTAQPHLSHQVDLASELLIEAIPGAVLRLLEDGTVLSFKTELDNNAGIYQPTVETLNRKLHEFLPENVATQFMGHLASALSGGGQQSFMYRILHETMLRNYQAKLVPFKEREALVVIRQSQEGDFFSGISHMLRSSLTSIRGGLGLLELGVLGALPSEAMEVVKGARFACDHMSQLIQDILELSNTEAGWPVSLRETDPSRCVEIAIERSQERAEQVGVLLKSEIAAEGRVLADKNLLIQALHRLISWALCCSPEGERVLVQVTSAPRALRFSITDFGNERPNLLQKLQSPKGINNSLPSTGIELALSKAIVEQLGAKLHVEHQSPQGTIFWFELPLAPAIEIKTQ